MPAGTILRHNFLPFRGGEDVETIIENNKDILIQCKDGRCGGISAVLAVCSRYLATVLAGQPVISEFSDPTTLILPSATVTQIKILHRFLLFGRIEASKGNAKDLRKIMRLLKVDIFTVEDIEVEELRTSHQESSYDVSILKSEVMQHRQDIVEEQILREPLSFKITEVHSLTPETSNNVDKIHTNGFLHNQHDIEVFGVYVEDNNLDSVNLVSTNDQSDIALKEIFLKHEQINNDNQIEMADVTNNEKNKDYLDDVPDDDNYNGTRISDVVNSDDYFNEHENVEKSATNINFKDCIKEDGNKSPEKDTSKHENQPVSKRDRMCKSKSLNYTDWEDKQPVEISNDGEKLCCQFCSEEFLHTLRFIRHLRYNKCNSVHAKVFNCPVYDCQYALYKDTYRSRFACLKGLHRHITSKHRDSERDFHCSQCERKFSSQMALHYHVKQHNDKSKFYCRMCCHFFPVRRRKIHNLKVHSNGKNNQSFKCGNCGKCFSSLINLETDNKLHDDKPKYKCSHCSRSFFQRNNLFVHQEKKHGWQLKEEKKSATDSADYTIVFCSVCDAIFLSETALNDHLNIVHSDVKKRFKCKECGKGFRRNGNLRKHEKVHESGEGEYCCTLCDRTFNEAGALKRHRTRKHPAS